jgi:subtilase family serine protease
MNARPPPIDISVVGSNPGTGHPTKMAGPVGTRRYGLLLFASLLVTLIAATLGPLEPPPNHEIADPTISPADIVAGSTALDGYSPQQIRRAYGIDRLQFDGVGETIAIVSAYDAPTVAGDLQFFSRRYNLPVPSGEVRSTCAARPTRHPCFERIRLAESLTYQEDWALDSTMAVEWAHAVAPGADILLVLAERASFDSLLAGVDLAVRRGARVVVMDWSSPEFAGEIDYDGHFEHSGVSFVAAAGDQPGVVGYPAASPRVLAVGGTTLRLAPDGAIRQEQPWPGSGWGTSQHERALPHQTERACAAASGRVVPDVAYSADPRYGYAVYSSSARYGVDGWFRLGGTSAGAPQWAGLLALADQVGAGLKTAGGDPLTRLYALSDRGVSSPAFRQVAGDGELHGCSATSNSVLFAPMTGLGSPIADRLVALLGQQY